MNVLRYFFSPKVLAPAALAVVLGLFSFAIANQNPAAASSNLDNDVIRGGYTTPAELAAKAAASSELQTIYKHAFASGYGVGDLANWQNAAQRATVYKDGRVVLGDGTIVGTSAFSLGRLKSNGNHLPITIGNKTYWYGETSRNFLSNSLPAYVLVNPDDHRLLFGALNACGNPVWATSPAYKCQMLNKEKVSDGTYKFTTKVFNENTTLTKLVYDFGDGKSQTITSDFSQAVTHTYVPGNYTAKVTAFFSANGQEKSDTRKDCTKPVEVPEPPKPVFECKPLDGKLIEGKRKYSFTATGTFKGGAKLVSADFDFGDGQKATNVTGVKKVSDTEATISVLHQYAQELAGKKTITASLTFTIGNDSHNKKCQTEIELTSLTCADKPSAPECQPPKKEILAAATTLPSTGPAETILSALGLGGATGAGLYYRAARRNWINQIFKR